MWLAYASLAAVCFGFRGILYHWTSQKPLDRNLMLFGVYLSGAITALLLALILGQQWTAPVWTGVVMGAFSFASNGAMYKGFSVGKASLVAVLTALTPVVVVALSYLRWGESLHLGQAFAFLVIVAGVVIIRYSGKLSLSDLKGSIWALIAMVTFGITDVSSKQARGVQRLRARSRMRLEPPTAQEQPAAAWSFRKTVGWGLFVGLTNISGMLLVLPAFQLGITGLVSAVLATNVLFILLYARLVLKERWSRREWIGIVCTLAGVLALRLLGA